MIKCKYASTFGALGLSAALLASTSGCQQLPGSPGTQGAAIGGVGGAATGALVGGEHHRLLGALLGGAVGAGGGYLIGANKDRIMGRDTSGAEAAMRNAQAHPATPQQALNAQTADLNGDGFVTMDEVVAMRQAGLSDQQILERMRATGQVFELTPEQQSYLRNIIHRALIHRIRIRKMGIRRTTLPRNQRHSSLRQCNSNRHLTPRFHRLPDLSGFPPPGKQGFTALLDL
jgi:hypothetical protein